MDLTHARHTLNLLANAGDKICKAQATTSRGAAIYLDPAGDGHPLTAVDALVALDTMVTTLAQFGQSVTGVYFDRWDEGI